MYGLLIETFVKDQEEKFSLFAAARTVPVIEDKIKWCLEWIKSDSCFAERLVAFACVEGIFFSGSFCSIFWLRKRGLMPGLCFSNELISRDEGLHTDFACHLYSVLNRKLPTEAIHRMVKSVVKIECAFCSHAIKTPLLGINANDMSIYIQFVADRLLLSLGVPRLFKVSNPFPWMESISLQGKTNFFEKRVGEYQRAGVMPSLRASNQSNYTFTLNADF